MRSKNLARQAERIFEQTIFHFFDIIEVLIIIKIMIQCTNYIEISQSSFLEIVHDIVYENATKTNALTKTTNREGEKQREKISWRRIFSIFLFFYFFWRAAPKKKSRRERERRCLSGRGRDPRPVLVSLFVVYDISISRRQRRTRRGIRS